MKTSHRRTWVASCSESGENAGFSVVGFHAFSAVWSWTACCSDTLITLRVGVWSTRLWWGRDSTALADMADRLNAGPPTMDGGGMYIGNTFTGKFGKKHWRRRASDDYNDLHRQRRTQCYSLPKTRQESTHSLKHELRCSHVIWFGHYSRPAARLRLAIVPWHWRPLQRTQASPSKNNKYIPKVT